MESDLEGDAGMRLSSRMGLPRFLKAFAPLTLLSLAGYLAWVTVAIGLWRETSYWTARGITVGRPIAALCLLCFLAGFAIRARAFAEQTSEVRNVISLSLMVASALALLALGPSTFTPILLIVIAVAIGAVYPLRAAVAALILLNLAFLAILMTRWGNVSSGFVLFSYGLFQAFALLTTLDRMRAHRMSRELREVNAQLLATRELLAESARDGE